MCGSLRRCARTSMKRQCECETMRQYSSKPAPFKGKVKITQHSGLRKLMRAARRGMIPEERLALIEFATRCYARPGTTAAAVKQARAA
jgi:hypothetical protein